MSCSTTALGAATAHGAPHGLEADIVLALKELGGAVSGHGLDEILVELCEANWRLRRVPSHEIYRTLWDLRNHALLAYTARRDDDGVMTFTLVS